MFDKALNTASMATSVPMDAATEPVNAATEAYSARALSPRAELNQHIAELRSFVNQHATAGTDKAAALNGLDLYLKSKVNTLLPDKLTLGMNRKYLGEVVELLKNRDIPQDTRIGAALELSRDLGCCSEGESLRLEETLRNLSCFGQNIGQRFVLTQQNMVKQALLKLVRQEYSPWLPNYDELEIHYVNALMNGLTGRYGIEYKADRYSKAHVFHEVGGMATELLNKTVTDAAVFQRVLEQVRDTCLGCLGAPDLSNAEREHYRYDQTKLDILASNLQANFGTSINLHDVLDYAEDYSTFRIKTDADLGASVLKALQKGARQQEGAPAEGTHNQRGQLPGQRGQLLGHQGESALNDLMNSSSKNVDEVLAEMKTDLRTHGQLTGGERAAATHRLANSHFLNFFGTIGPAPDKKHDKEGITQASGDLTGGGKTTLQNLDPEPESPALGSKNPGGSEPAQ